MSPTGPDSAPLVGQPVGQPADRAAQSAGRERTVALRDAERELGKTWAALDEASRGGGGEGMLRLREVNLVVLCDEQVLAESRQTADLLTQVHPGRLIFIVVDPDDGRVPGPDAPAVASVPSASIATTCLVDDSSGHHVCSEEVLIRGVPGEGEALRAAVLQLLVPDVPVVGWWVGELAGHPPGLRWLTGIADQVVVDLGRSLAPLAGLETLRDLMREEGGARIQELEWLRSAHWRALTAELFEQSETRALIPLMTYLEVEQEGAPLQALLYGAWFVSRLGLEPGEGGWWVEGGSLCVDLVAAGPADESSRETRAVSTQRPTSLPSHLVMRLRSATADGHERAGLTSIRIRSRSAGGGQERPGQAGADEQSVALRRWPRSCLCSMAVGPEEDELVVKSLRFTEREDYQDLSRLIDTPLRDALLYDALPLAGELVERPGFDLAVLLRK